MKRFLVTTRNQKVTEALQSLYQVQIPAANLPIFCISNVDYWEHRDRPKDQALPFLQLSGILQIRKHCLSLVAEGQLRAATNYITNAIPALLGSTELWIQAGVGSMGAERKQAIRSALNRIKQELEAVSILASRAVQDRGQSNSAFSTDGCANLDYQYSRSDDEPTIHRADHTTYG